MSSFAYDLYQLQEDVLLLKNDDFFEFVTQVAGKLEAKILQIQGIQNTRALLRSTDLLNVFKFDCDELNELKNEASWRCKDGQFIVKQGIELNFQILMEALQDTHKKYIKRIKDNKKTVSTFPRQCSSTLTEPNIFHEQTSLNSSTTVEINPSQSFTSTMFNAANDSTHIPLLIIDQHISSISNLINKYSKKIFETITLLHNEHYQLSLVEIDHKCKAIIQCQCGSKILLPFREDSSTFILLNYYVHLSDSNCPMINKLMKENRQLNHSSPPQSQSSSTDKEVEFSSSTKANGVLNSHTIDKNNDCSPVKSMLNDKTSTTTFKRKRSKPQPRKFGAESVRRKKSRFST